MTRLTREGLTPGGAFITQQVGGKNHIRLNEILQERVEMV